jgi:hypothetical protein
MGVKKSVDCRRLLLKIQQGEGGICDEIRIRIE